MSEKNPGVRETTCFKTSSSGPGFRQPRNARQKLLFVGVVGWPQQIARY
jgi:hypothetical protein